jgi:predicted nucleotidyltransferase
MPVRSLRSSVLKWPDATAVDRAVRAWAVELAGQRRDLLGIAYFGSYARGDWGVGSDLDLVVIVKQSVEPFWMRPLGLDLGALPVPAEALIYTADEWRAMARERGRFFRTVEQEAVWIYRDPSWEG